MSKRDNLIIEAIKEGLSVKEIAARVGVEEDYAKKLRAKLARQHGLTVTAGSTPSQTYGMTEDSMVMRGRLMNKLSNLVNIQGIHPVEVALMTGVTQTAQTENRVRPWTYDWKLSELERLAAVEGVSISELLLEVIGPRKSGEIL